MQQDWLISILKFVRLNLGILLVSLGLFIVLVWGGSTYLNFKKNSLVSQVDTQAQISATATIVPSATPVAQVEVTTPTPLATSKPVATNLATPSPTPQPILTQLPVATPTPTASISAKIAVKPSATPTASPTVKPTIKPTATPTPTSTPKPTPLPTVLPKAVEAPRAMTKGGLPVDGSAAAAPTTPTLKEGTYTVQKGDSSWKLAEKFYGSGYKYVEIEKANNLKHNQYLEIGQLLSIPEKQSLSDAKATSEKITTKGGQTVDSQVSQSSGKTYVVKAGDSLWSIAGSELQNAYRWSEIYARNKQTVGRNPGLIYPGQNLVLPTAQATATQPQGIQLSK